MANDKELSNDPEKTSVSLRLKYVKLAYHYLSTHFLYLILMPIFAIIFVHQKDLFPALVVIIFLATFYFMNATNTSRNIYMLDFACYKPDEALMCSKEHFMKCSTLAGTFTDENLAFQKKILERSGLGQKTYLSQALLRIPPDPCMSEARKEAEMVMFGAIDQLQEKVKNHVKVKDIGILVLNCSMFNPTPSLSAAIVNRYKLRGKFLSYNLGGMGCSAGMISIDLAKRLLQVQPNCYALVMSLECNWYRGNDRSMLISNCIFRMGGAAILLSNRSIDRFHSKYQLIQTVRTHMGSDDKAYNSVHAPTRRRQKEPRHQAVERHNNGCRRSIKNKYHDTRAVGSSHV